MVPGSKLPCQFPELRWVAMDSNSGFARANNAGIKLSNGDSVLLLNPDTIILKDAVSQCYSRIMKSNFVATEYSCLTQMVHLISGNYVPLGGINLLMQVPYFGGMLKWIARMAGVKATNFREAKKGITEVDWINGAFLMVKKSAIEKAGMLDEDFFLYHEESEWCSRLKKTGNLCIFGDLKVIHLEGQSTNKAFASATSGYSNLSDTKGYQLMLSMFVRIRKEFGAEWFLFHLLCYTIAIPFVLVFSLFHSLISFSINPLSNCLGFSKNVFKCWNWISTLFSNKPHFYKVL